MATRLEQEAAANRRRHLELAALSLLLLKRRRDAVVATGLAAREHPIRIATNIREALRGGITTARRVTRAGGVDRLASEFDSLGLDIGLSRSEAQQLLVDAHRAGVASESYRRQWLEKVTAGATPREASASTDHAIERTAITEASDAYNAGRLAYLEEAVGVELLRVWDSAFDSNTCPVCAAADGTTVGLNESFPLGEPGSVHPRCMCSWHLAEAGSKRTVAAVPANDVSVVREAERIAPATPAIAAEGYSREQRTERAARAYERMVRSEVVPQQLKRARRTSEFKALLGGIDEKQLDFFRSGYRAKIDPYAGAVGKQINRIATGAGIPNGSSMPLPPIVINIFPKSERFRTEGAIAQLQDGRHRLEAAQAAGATEIRAKIRLYDRELNTVWESDRIIPVPRIDPTNLHGRM